MYFKVLCCLVLIAITWAHEHQDAYSSVYIMKADDHPEVIRHRHHDRHGYHDNHDHHDHHDQHDDHIDYYTYPKFKYGFRVHSPHTGDIKSEQVMRDGTHVKGVYSLLQPDGYERVVNFHSNDKTGFHADVKYNTYHPMHEHRHHHH